VCWLSPPTTGWCDLKIVKNKKRKIKQYYDNYTYFIFEVLIIVFLIGGVKIVVVLLSFGFFIHCVWMSSSCNLSLNIYINWSFFIS
jgi:hypothetical protein